MKKEIEKILNEYRYSIGRTAGKWDSNAIDVDQITKRFANKIISLFEAKLDECKDDVLDLILDNRLNMKNWNSEVIMKDILSIIKAKLKE